MQAAIELSNWQLAVLVVLPSLVTVAAWLNSNSRIGDLSAQLLQFRSEVSPFRSEIDQRIRDVNQRRDVLTGIVDGIDRRVTKVEACLPMEWAGAGFPVRSSARRWRSCPALPSFATQPSNLLD